MKTILRNLNIALAIAILASGSAFAQNKVKSETIRDPKAKSAAVEILRDFSNLPEAARKKREEILTAAKAGDIDKVAALVKADQTTISFGGDTDAAEFWKRTFPDSNGLEALATLIEILEMPFVHLDKGSKQEMFVWPYFYAVNLDRLTTQQRVELFRLVTAYDYREMQKFGSYNFFRLGLSTDGRWHFFVAGD